MKNILSFFIMLFSFISNFRSCKKNIKRKKVDEKFSLNCNISFCMTHKTKENWIFMGKFCIRMFRHTEHESACKIPLGIPAQKEENFLWGVHNH